MSDNEYPSANLDDGFVVRRVGIVEFPEVMEFPREQVYIVGLAEYTDGSGRNLIFQMAYANDKQDVRLGLDTYCVTNEMAAVVYGGVTACVLEIEEEQLLLRFTPEAATELDVPERCRLRLEVDQLSVEQMRQGLRRVFTGQREMPEPLVL